MVTQHSRASALQSWFLPIRLSFAQKEALLRQRFEDYATVEQFVCSWLQIRPKSLYDSGLYSIWSTDINSVK